MLLYCTVSQGRDTTSFQDAETLKCWLDWAAKIPVGLFGRAGETPK